jgi:hypothetical protein
MNYLEAVLAYDSTIQCSIVGDPDVYENINWGATPVLSIPTKEQLDAIKLLKRKEKIITAIKEYREVRKTSGVFVAGKWFNSDEKSRTQWLGLKDKAKDALANGGNNQTQLTINHPQYGLVSINWVTMDGSTKFVTVELAFAVFEKIGDLDGLHHGIALYYINQVQNSSNPESIDYKQNSEKNKWPIIYGE